MATSATAVMLTKTEKRHVKTLIEGPGIQLCQIVSHREKVSANWRGEHTRTGGLAFA